ncbi:MAG: hypothetical protein VX574_07590 [Myxococcota bacterium]|nr:hypothetical protein [Myxococcota bacterium]
MDLGLQFLADLPGRVLCDLFEDDVGSEVLVRVAETFVGVVARDGRYVDISEGHVPAKEATPGIQNRHSHAVVVAMVRLGVERAPARKDGSEFSPCLGRGRIAIRAVGLAPADLVEFSLDVGVDVPQFVFAGIRLIGSDGLAECRKFFQVVAVSVQHPGHLKIGRLE